MYIGTAFFGRMFRREFYAYIGDGLVKCSRC